MKAVRTLGYDQPTDDQKDAISSFKLTRCFRNNSMAYRSAWDIRKVCYSAQSYTMEVTASSLSLPRLSLAKHGFLRTYSFRPVERERTVNLQKNACIFASGYWPNKTRSFGAVFFSAKDTSYLVSHIQHVVICKPEAGQQICNKHSNYITRMT